MDIITIVSLREYECIFVCVFFVRFFALPPLRMEYLACFCRSHPRPFSVLGLSIKVGMYSVVHFLRITAL